jgi:hypothetical protein
LIKRISATSKSPQLRAFLFWNRLIQLLHSFSRSACTPAEVQDVDPDHIDRLGSKGETIAFFMQARES